jgi:hypothetical protein
MTYQAGVDALAAATLVTTAETVVGVFDSNPLASPHQGVAIWGVVNVTPGTAATGITVRIRSGATTAGTLIGTADLTTVIATDAQSIPFGAIDSAVFPAGRQYCVTLQATAATGNSTVNDIFAMLDVITEYAQGQG